MANRAGGRIVALRVDRHEVLIVLDNDPETGPLGNAFSLEATHAEFNAAYSLLLAAAANRWPVLIRIGGAGEIDKTVKATVHWVSVGWRAGTLDDD